MLKPTDRAVGAGDWKARAYVMRQRRSEPGLLKAYDMSFGCGRVGGSHPTCSNVRCLRCWLNLSSLEEQGIACSRFKHGAHLKASNGQGRCKGGNIRDKLSTMCSSLVVIGRGWWRRRRDMDYLLRDDDPVDMGELTMGRILFFS